VAWETVKACYAEMAQEAERLRKMLGEGGSATLHDVKAAPAARTTKTITVTRAAKKGFERTVRSPNGKGVGVMPSCFHAVDLR
jgi:hypothetical protein